MKQWIIGSFDERAAAESAVERLTDLGFKRDEVSVVMNDDRRTRDFGGDDSAVSAAAPDRGTNIAKGAAGGGMVGGTLAAIAAAVVGTGAVGLTVVTGGVAAPFIAGPLAAALAAGGAGAAAGSVIGGLIGAGMPERDAQRVDRDVANGNIVISVHADDAMAPAAHRILDDGAVAR